MDIVGDLHHPCPAFGTGVSAMDLGGQSDSPSSSANSSGGGVANNKLLTNTYSYPTFPYIPTTGATTTVDNTGAFCGRVADSTSAAVTTMMHVGLPSVARRGCTTTHPQHRILLKMSVRLIQTYENINEVGCPLSDKACSDAVLETSYVKCKALVIQLKAVGYWRQNLTNQYHQQFVRIKFLKLSNCRPFHWFWKKIKPTSLNFEVLSGYKNAVLFFPLNYWYACPNCSFQQWVFAQIVRFEV